VAKKNIAIIDRESTHQKLTMI